MRLGALGLVAGLLTAWMGAQTRPEPTGSVAGRVLCEDTNGPARSAMVHLEKAESADAGKKLSKGETGGSRDLARDVLQTDLSGEFLFEKVPPGEYFVDVEMAGYLSARAMFTEKEMDDPSPEMRELVGRALNRIRVEAGHTERVQVRLDRGAAVSGTVRFDDGAPASGLQVKLLKKSSDKWEEVRVPTGALYAGGQTDDRGGFRIAGPTPETYLLEADLALRDEHTTSTKNGVEGQSMEFMMMKLRFTLPFYGAGMARQGEAKPFTLGRGQERDGEDVTIPLTKLHRLTGAIVAKRDGHAVNAGRVELVYRDDGKQLATADVRREDGRFQFDFVPEGDYVIQTIDAHDATWETVKNANTGFPPTEKETLIVAYGTAERPLLLRGDMSDVTLTVPEKTESKGAGSAAASPGPGGR